MPVITILIRLLSLMKMTKRNAKDRNSISSSHNVKLAINVTAILGSIVSFIRHL
jgi:hypothetical protein